MTAHGHRASVVAAQNGHLHMLKWAVENDVSVMCKQLPATQLVLDVVHTRRNTCMAFEAISSV